MTAPAKMTPMLRQYFEIKEQHRNDILFYRMGDFYEMFFEDAETASKILNITLTSRSNKNDAVQVPMCGVPYHAAQSYIAKLVRSGRRVAICEQTEDPAEAKGIVKREVVRVVTPGVVTDAELLQDKENCYVCAICRETSSSPENWGISFLDLSTGAFLAGEFSDDHPVPEQVLDQLCRMAPAELVVSQAQRPALEPLLKQAALRLDAICITECEADRYHPERCREILLEHFGVTSLDGFGCGSMRQGIIAAAVLLGYAEETQKTDMAHIERLAPIDLGRVLIIDDSSRRNLELTRTIIGNKKEGSLLWVLDKTETPMGARLLTHNLLNPLQDIERITERLDAVDYLFHHPSTRQRLRELLRSIYDLERLNSRMVLGHGNGRDALSLKQTCAALPAIRDLIGSCSAPKLQRIGDQFDPLTDLHDLLESALADSPPVSLRDGNLIKAGYHEELDRLVSLLRDGKKHILGLETTEREATGIAKLKIGYNKVFGYFIEIGKAHLDKIPAHYIRKQTLVNAERFITPELKDFEHQVLTAQERRLELEYRLFLEIRGRLAENSSRLAGVAQLLARIDLFCCLAEIASHYHYTRPVVTTGQDLCIVEGRHPVIERSLPAGKFVPNDIDLDQTDNQLLVITGPNMAGKSTVLRQTALIVLLAQMGSFVPAERATVGIVDRIFTRVGAMDDLRRGQSTFMVEMSETANILNNATPNSLVILDEIGRGTSTYDGLAIAWSVAEALVNKAGVGVKTLFATHYHELTELSRQLPRVQNYSVAVKEWNDTIIFLHKLVRGGTSRSYGIQVAGLAGVPNDVVRRAEEILQQIERSNPKGTIASKRTSASGNSATAKPKRPSQLSLFSAPVHPVLERLQKVSVDDMTPREALACLYELRDLL